MTTKPDSSLDLLVAMVRDGLDFFRSAAQRTSDPDVAEAFRHVADTHWSLLQDLASAGVIDDPRGGQSWPLVGSLLGYAKLEPAFDPEHPETLADALQRREQAIGTLIEKLFESREEPGLRNALKGFYPKVLEAQRIWTKLDQRPRAA